MTAFGDFAPLCTNTPSYPWCNLFHRQLQRNASRILTGPSATPASAPVGINPKCGIPRLNHDGSISNVANIAACGVSVFFVVLLIVLCNRRKAAVGRIELRSFLTLYLLTLPLQLLSTGALLAQGSTALVVLTAVHAGMVAALFWTLLANAIVATQVVEDGTSSSLIPFGIFTIFFLGVTTYVSLDIGLGVTELIGGMSTPPEALGNVPLFVLTSVWPAA
ncbi:chitin synthase III catalytic subunit [Ephemerocybe angulata]|uniref:Chitin synthase III catalytic subunit n=1 Tax=Ephemerocybe angulata TaxID=980116 RepID=A0A8H6M2C5_9AGAR|nr:chitin synthase III catalytic subunit [Tulosesus angulatus]